MDYHTPVAKLLLTKIPEIAASSLFKSQAEIAQCIVDLPNSKYDDPLSLRSYLSQVLQGHRPWSDHLAECIVSVALKRVVGTRKRAAESLLLDAIQAHNELVTQQQHLRSRSKKKVTRGEIYGTMRSIQAEASSVFIINTRPLELARNPIDQRQKEFVLETIQALRAGTPYIFCVPDERTAAGLWLSFYEEILPLCNADKKNADDLLTDLEKKNVLTIYTIPPRDCVHPTVVYDAGLPERASGWIWYVPWDPDELAEMPKEVIERWRQEYFDPIRMEEFEGQKRFTWDQAKKKMPHHG